jgi:ketosteroid isomerase-like protein
MSQENVDRFVEATHAFNRGDVATWLGLYDAEVVFEPQVAEMEGAYVGHDGIRAFITNIGDLYERFEVRLHDVRDLGERVLALGSTISIGKGSGIEQEAPLAIVASFRGGRITHFMDYGDKVRAFDAVGISE